MDNFNAIYKILKLLDKHKGDEEFDYELISAKAMKMKVSDWEQIMIELQMNGFIRGLVYTQDLTNKFPHIVEPIHPQITLKGMEYLSENSIMKKVEKDQSLEQIADALESSPKTLEPIYSTVLSAIPDYNDAEKIYDFVKSKRKERA